MMTQQHELPLCLPLNWLEEYRLWEMLTWTKDNRYVGSYVGR